MTLDPLYAFIDIFLSKIGELGIDVSSYNMDHVAYQASSSEDYENVTKELSVYGELIHEPVIGGRRVGMIKLKIPIEYKGNKILALEIIEPKEGQQCVSDWEHAEFVVNDTLEDFMNSYPALDWDTSSIDRPLWAHLKLRLADNMQLKFHTMDVLETIKLDKGK